MRTVLTHCYGERRRIAFASVMAFVAGVTLYSHLSISIFGVPFPIFAGTLYLVVVGLAAALTTFLFPKIRRLVDGIAVARVTLAFLTVATQNYVLVEEPLASALIVVSSAVFILAAGKYIAGAAKNGRVPRVVLPVVTAVNAFFNWLDNSEEHAQPLDA